jgi:hypothetical protein
VVNKQDLGWQRQAQSSDSCLRRNDVTPAQAGVADGWPTRHRQGLRKAFGLAAATRRRTLEILVELTNVE